MTKSPLIGKMKNRVVTVENVSELPPMVMVVPDPTGTGVRTLNFKKLMYRALRYHSRQADCK